MALVPCESSIFLCAPPGIAHAVVVPIFLEIRVSINIYPPESRKAHDPSQYVELELSRAFPHFSRLAEPVLPNDVNFPPHTVFSFVLMPYSVFSRSEGIRAMRFST